MIKMTKQNEDFNIPEDEIEKFIKADTTHILIDEESNEIVASFTTTVAINADNQAKRFFSAPIDREDEVYYEIVKLDRYYNIRKTLEIGGVFYSKRPGEHLTEHKIHDIRDGFVWFGVKSAELLSNFIYNTDLKAFTLK